MGPMRIMGRDSGRPLSREEGEGALRISFYNQDSETRAYELLKKYNYTLIK